MSVLLQLRTASLAADHGVRWGGDQPGTIKRLAEAEEAGDGDLVVCGRKALEAVSLAAWRRGAIVIAKDRPEEADGGQRWGIHASPLLLLAALLDHAEDTRGEPELGVGVKLAPGVLLERGARVGDHVEIGAYSVIGQQGFGFVESAGRAKRIRHLGGVVIESNVSLGALVTVDAGTLSPTRIGEHSHLDSHVHIGHNVQIGAHTMIAAQSGIAGSARIGSHVRIGGQVGIADHVMVGDKAQIAAKSGVLSKVPEAAIYAGYPAVERTRYFRWVATLLRGDVGEGE